MGQRPLDFDQLSNGPTLANLRALAAFLSVPLPENVTQRLAAQILARALKRGTARRKIPSF